MKQNLEIMEVKKNDKVNIEKTKGTYFQLGLVVILSLLLIAFEWTTGPKGDNEFDLGNGELIDEELIPITEREQEEPEIPPEIPTITDIFEIVEDNVILDTEIIFESDDAKIDDEVAMYRFDIEEEVEEKEENIFFTVEEMPTFRGGDQSKFSKWVQNNVHYPPIASENRIQGKVYIGFVVESDGSVSNVTLTRGVEPALDNEALRAVRNSPKWAAGKQRGAPVRVRFTITVNFQLQ